MVIMGDLSMIKLIRASLIIFFLCGSEIFGQTPHQKQQALNSIDKIRQDILDQISELWIEIEKPEWKYLAKKNNGLDGELIIEYSKICDKMDNFTQPIVPNTILQYIWSKFLIEKEINNINVVYDKFRKLQTRPDSEIYAKSWEDIAQSILTDSANKNSIFKSLDVLQNSLINDNTNESTTTSIFDTVKKASQYQLCNVAQSTNQLIFNMYTILQMTQLKAYTMIRFSWMLLKTYNKGNFSTESNLIRVSYLKKMSQQATALRSTTVNATNDLWKCDPRNHVEDKTYTEITKFLQGFIINEVDMNKGSNCGKNCVYYQTAQQYSCFKNQFCEKQLPCKGNIVGCMFIDSDMWICQAPHSSSRRYDWIEYENGKILGEKQSCRRDVKKVDSWWRGVVHCSYCFCFCEDAGDNLSHRYFNLREVTSDTANNKVIIGIRFIKSNRVIHMQILESELLPNGEINSTTISWRPIDNYEVEHAKEGVDYHMLTWEHRAIDLDDLLLPKDHVLTGIKFRKIGGHLNLEIRGSEFNISSGKLKHGGTKNTWISNDNTDGALNKPRRKLGLFKPDVPTKYVLGQGKPDSESDQFMEFTHSDIDSDAGQSVVPFIDTQLVIPEPPVPLVGAGIYHKGGRYSGGFIAPKIFTFDYSQQILTDIPEINDKEV